jgi:hypothetical protein
MYRMHQLRTHSFRFIACPRPLTPVLIGLMILGCSTSRATTVDSLQELPWVRLYSGPSAIRVLSANPSKPDSLLFCDDTSVYIGDIEGTRLVPRRRVDLQATVQCAVWIDDSVYVGTDGGLFVFNSSLSERARLPEVDVISVCVDASRRRCHFSTSSGRVFRWTEGHAKSAQLEWPLGGQRAFVCPRYSGEVVYVSSGRESVAIREGKQKPIDLVADDGTPVVPISAWQSGTSPEDSVIAGWGGLAVSRSGGNEWRVVPQSGIRSLAVLEEGKTTVIAIAIVDSAKWKVKDVQISRDWGHSFASHSPPSLVLEDLCFAGKSLLISGDDGSTNRGGIWSRRVLP